MTNRYENGKIYTIRSHMTEKYYIGSTCMPLHKRLHNHRTHYKNWLKDNANYITSYELLKYDDVYIELLEDVKCNNKMELLKREGELIRQYKDKIFNMNIPNRTIKEWTEDNKDNIKVRMKKYYQDNKETIITQHKLNTERIRKVNKEWRNKKFKCDKCNIEMVYCSKYAHNKTQRHLNNCESVKI
jgi:hypothetical protein